MLSASPGCCSRTSATTRLLNVFNYITIDNGVIFTDRKASPVYLEATSWHSAAVVGLSGVDAHETSCMSVKSDKNFAHNNLLFLVYYALPI